MTITESSIIKALKHICHAADRKYPKIKFKQNGKTKKMRSYYHLLKLDGNVEGLARKIWVEIASFKQRNNDSHYSSIAKHQWVSILKSFVEQSGPGTPGFKKELGTQREGAPPGEFASGAWIHPVMGDIADFMINMINQSDRPKYTRLF
jgi:hypothetical protein